MRRNAAEDIDGRVVAIGVSRSRRSRPTNGLTGKTCLERRFAPDICCRTCRKKRRESSRAGVAADRG